MVQSGADSTTMREGMPNMITAMAICGPRPMSGHVISALTSGTLPYTSMYSSDTRMIAEKMTWQAQNMPNCRAVPLSP